MSFFSVFIFTVISVSPAFSQSSPGLKDSEAALEEEFKWLRAEAEATLSIATRTEMTEETAPSIVSVITGEQIRNMGARTIVDVLKTLPGFDLTHYAVLPTHKISVRGMSSTNSNEKVRIMINGHCMKDFYWEVFGPHFDALPLANIRKIEIIRGPGSALYGTDAFLGVINIITEQGGDRPSEVSVESGTCNTLKPYGELSYRKKDFKAYLYADYYSTDGYDGNVEADYATRFFGQDYSAAPGKLNSKDRHYAFQADIRYKDLYFSGFFSRSDTDYPAGFYYALADENDVKTWYGYAETGYRLPVGDTGHLGIKVYHDRADVNTTIEILSEQTAQMPGMYEGFPADEGVYEGVRSCHAISGAELTADSSICSGIQLAGGMSYEYIRHYGIKHYANYNLTGQPVELGGIRYEAFPPFQYFSGGITDLSEKGIWITDKDREIAAFYTEGIFDLKQLFSLNKGVENLSVTLGGRYDRYDDIGSSTNPSLGIVYAPTKKFWFKALYGEAFRAPDFSEIYLENYSDQEKAPSLKPEKIATTECLIGYHFTPDISASLTGFHVRGSDLIAYRASGITALLTNIGKMKSYGAEAELKASFGKFQYAYLNFTWQKVKDTTHAEIEGTTERQEDFNPGGIPEFYGNIGMNYDFFNEHVIAGLSLNYTGERKRSEKKSLKGENLVQTDQRDPVKELYLFNASLTFRNFFKGMEIQISGFNLFNADHRSPAPRSLANDMPEAGRTFTGRISYSF